MTHRWAPSGRRAADLEWCRRGVAALLLLALTVPLVAINPARVAAASVFADGFESGNLAAWTVGLAGDGSASASTSVVRTGAYALRLKETASSTSLANVRHTMTVSQTSLTVAADVNVLAEGATGSNVPLIRLFDANGARLVNVYRQNNASNKVYVQHSGQYVLTSGTVLLGAWRRIEARVTTSGAASSIAVLVDGAIVYQTSSANLGTSGVRTVQLGNEVRGQAFELAADNVELSVDGGDTTAPDTTITAGPSGSVASSSAQFSFTSSEAGSRFECSLDGAAWTNCQAPASYTGLANGGHTFRVRAIDGGQNADPTPAERTWTVALTGGCDPGTPQPTNADPGQVVVADNFESGLGSWTKVTAQGDAVVSTQPDNYRTGRCALRLHVTTAIWDSRASVTKTLPTGTNEIWQSGWFNVEVEGASDGWNTPTFRTLSNGKRVLDVSRQNVTGNVFVRFPNPAGGWSYIMTGRRMNLRQWYHVRIHAIANGNLSTVEVWIDGTRVVNTNQATFGVTRFDVAMVGAEHQNQEGDVAADDVIVKAIVPPPTNVLFTDGFESGTLGGWSVQLGGNGTASVVADGTAGSNAGQLTSTTTSGALSNLRSTFTSAQADVVASADVRVAAQGASGAEVPLLALNQASGAPLVAVSRVSGSGVIRIAYGGTTVTTSEVLPLDSWREVKVHAIAAGAGVGTVEAWLGGTLIHRSTTASIGTTGARSLMLGSGAGGRAYTILVDRAVVTTGPEGPVNDPRYKLLIADYLNKRLLITDFDGRVVWKFDNPVNSTLYTAGPIGVRWLPGNKILATFGSGEVGVIDVASKTWDWQTKGYNGDWFQSPYDAELLPDGNLAVALRFNNGGRISVYNRATGEEVWKHYLSNAHSVHFRTPGESYNSDDPTLLVGGWGNVREVAYRTNGGQNVTWQVKTEFTHDAMVVENDRLLTIEGYYVQKIERSGIRVWRKMTPDEDRRVAVNPNLSGGYVFTVAESDRVEFRDVNGDLLRDWSMLSDGTGLDYPYGIQVIDYPG